jgi:hypothetical protein
VRSRTAIVSGFVSWECPQTHWVMTMADLLDERAIRGLVQQLDTEDGGVLDAVWEQLRPMREALVPALVEFYPSARKWKCRASILFSLHPFARNVRTTEQVFNLAVVACDDRARIVRYWACSLLAHSRRRSAIPKLKQLLTHPDPQTAADAKAAITAIRWCCPEYYRFRKWNLVAPSRWEVVGAEKPLPWWRRTLNRLRRSNEPDQG